MIEGSGSIPLTSGSGSWRPKNMWIRIRNTDLQCIFHGVSQEGAGWHCPIPHPPSIYFSPLCWSIPGPRSHPRRDTWCWPVVPPPRKASSGRRTGRGCHRTLKIYTRSKETAEKQLSRKILLSFSGCLMWLLNFKIPSFVWIYAKTVVIWIRIRNLEFRIRILEAIQLRIHRIRIRKTALKDSKSGIGTGNRTVGTEKNACWYLASMWAETVSRIKIYEGSAKALVDAY